MPVYFLQEMPGGRVKIGYSANPESRARGLSTGNSSELAIIGTVNLGDESEERALEVSLHQELSEFSVRGEWFHPVRELFLAMEREVDRSVVSEPSALEGLVPPVWAGEPPVVYLAGKVQQPDWRSVLGLKDRDWSLFGAGCEFGGFSFRYGGPLIPSCDHRCFHSSDVAHKSVGSWCTGSVEFGRREVEMGSGRTPEEDQSILVAQCMSSVTASHTVVAYINSPDCYGTIAEIGYASASGIPVFVGFSANGFVPKPQKYVGDEVAGYTPHTTTSAPRYEDPNPSHEMWFIERMPNVHSFGRVDDPQVLVAKSLIHMAKAMPSITRAK